ncbi:alkaline phosphatase family protein [Thalassotalea profundi]|uniref:Alkaline phosphatase family protein n=1 Tax=Thalassotalea profundi TaxID=2036687 RepID=A0ABQ3IFB0_9GAMM|nr:ectonucleotide pyrophosphatase/phosphodiesterase [Thalassotalea profundi]GHE82508.1 alkaline phosphatase family protein [Thalassotalea profundi]
MKYFVFIFCLFAFQCKSQTTTILISIDGFAAHYLKQYKPKNLLALANQGITTKGLIPSYPTKTFPNHLTLVTGKAPFEHGIVLNKFYDKGADDFYSYGRGKSKNQWLKYPPIWTLLEQNSVPTAIYFWPESEKSYQNILPTYYKNYDGKVPNEERFEQMLAWLKIRDENKPKLIVSYFSTIDSVGHHYGRQSPKLEKAIHLLDQQIGAFVDDIQTSIIEPVNIIIVSDHGMVKTGKENALLESTIIPKWVNNEFVVIQNGTQIFMYNTNNDKQLINQAYQSLLSANEKNKIKRYEVFNSNTYPANWKVTLDSSFVPDIIISAIPPTTFTSDFNQVHVETHGFETKYSTDLNGIFIATGPDFNKKIQLEPMSNMEVFPILAKIFSLNLPDNEKSRIEAHQKILKIK